MSPKKTLNFKKLKHSVKFEHAKPPREQIGEGSNKVKFQLQELKTPMNASEFEDIAETTPKKQ
jgi:hypothetical protein